jgi:hypothetical protein
MRTHVWLTAAALLWALAGSSAIGKFLKRLEQRLAPAPPTPEKAGGAASAADRDSAYLGLVADNAEGRDGVLVMDVNPDSPAAVAGLKSGDVITRANGRPVASLDDLAKVLHPLAPGSKIDFTVLAGDEEKTKSVTLGRRPPQEPAAEGTTAPMPPAPRDDAPRNDTPRIDGPRKDGAADRSLPSRDDDDSAFDFATGRPSLGITVGPITEDARARYNLTTRRGALIVAVRPGSAADRAGLPMGGAVVSMDGVRIDTADQLVDAIRTSRPGQEVELGYYRGPEFTRKTVRLDATGVPVEGPRPGVRIEVGPGDRPLLHAAERMFDSLARPGTAGSVAAPGDSPQLQAMQEEILELRDQVKTLEDRVRALEAKLNATGAAAPRGAAAPADTGLPGARFNGPGPTLPLNAP